VVLAGHGFRTEAAAHSEAQEALGRPVVSLRLIDPRFYHLDVALAPLDDENIAYFPGAFLRLHAGGAAATVPAAVLADEEDALAFGLTWSPTGATSCSTPRPPRWRRSCAGGLPSRTGGAHRTEEGRR